MSSVRRAAASAQATTVRVSSTVVGAMVHRLNYVIANAEDDASVQMARRVRDDLNALIAEAS